MTEDLDDMEPGTLVRMGTIEAFNEEGRESAEKYFTDDLDYYNSAGEHGDFDTLYADGEEFATAFPDLDADVLDTISDGDEVMFHYRARGTHENPMGELPATGESFETQGIGYAKVRDGRIAEYQLIFDNLGMLQQLGVF